MSILGVEDFGFTLEARQPVGVSRQRRREKLDGDLALQPRVRRPINLPHAAGAKGGDDFVVAEAGAGRQEHESKPILDHHLPLRGNVDVAPI